MKLQVDVMADSSCLKWVPTMSHFFRRDTEFERFTINFNFRNITEQELSPLNLTNYSFHIESNGRARDMFMFNHVGQRFYVTTDAEVYITDKEYVTAKEARQWYKHRFDKSHTAFYVPFEAPPLSSSIQSLIDKVNNIDKDSLRLDLVPDHRLMAKHDSRKNFRIGNRALAILKQLTGISAYKSNRNNNVWNNFKKKWTKRNGTEQKKRLYYSEEKDDNSQQPR